MILIALIAVGYVAFLVFMLALLTSAKRSDEAIDDALRGEWEVAPPACRPLPRPAQRRPATRGLRSSYR